LIWIEVIGLDDIGLEGKKEMKKKKKKKKKKKGQRRMKGKK